MRQQRVAAVIDPGNVPSTLHELIPLAEYFGVTDDLEREQLVSSADPKHIAQLQTFVSKYGDELDAWLAGSEADGPQYSQEYLAFSAMRMAADFA